MCGWGPYAREASVWEACCWYSGVINMFLNCLRGHQVCDVPDEHVHGGRALLRDLHELPGRGAGTAATQLAAHTRVHPTVHRSREHGRINLVYHRAGLVNTAAYAVA